MIRVMYSCIIRCIISNVLLDMILDSSDTRVGAKTNGAENSRGGQRITRATFNQPSVSHIQPGICKFPAEEPGQLFGLDFN